jgi:hypothetical protein
MMDVHEMTQEERYRVFTEEMEAAGYEVNPEYGGRFFYRGPAVEVPRDDLQEVIRSTIIPLQWDQMGRSRLIIYPK